MSPELIAILGVGVALAEGLSILAREHGERLARIETPLDHIEARLDRLEERLLPQAETSPPGPAIRAVPGNTQMIFNTYRMSTALRAS